MAKSKAKRPVGRPKKPKTQSTNEGKVFGIDYGAFRIDVYSEPGKECIRHFDTMFERFYNSLVETQERADAIVKRLASDHTVSEVMRSELQECSMFAELLRRVFEDSLRKGKESGHLTEAYTLALAYTAGQLSIVAPLREHEASYAVGQKVAEAAKHGAKSRALPPPPKQELLAFINSQLSKHGKKKHAIDNCAKHYGVSPNTIRNWLKRLDLEFNK